MEWPKLFSADEILVGENIEIKDIEIDDGSIEFLLRELSYHFERISKSLELLVGTKEFEKELYNLIIDDTGSRRGFPPHVFSILLKLSTRHAEKFQF